jgi:hypothetical protein
LKIEQLIVQYLYSYKQVALPGIGTIKLKTDIVLPTAGDKDFIMPADAFSFEYNLKAVEDERFVDYIVQHTNKIKPLASSDLESYAILAKQFLNIGKPLVIEGVGTIQKSQQGFYEFSSGHFITPRIDDIPKLVKEKREEPISFESESTGNNNNKNIIIAVTLFAGIALAVFAAYYFLVLKQPESSAVIETPLINEETVKKDTAKTSVAAIDTIKKNTVNDSSILINPAALKTDSSSFKIVIKVYHSEKAINKAYSRLKSYGHKLLIVKVDSINYKLMMPFYKPLSDTARVRDSLKIFFGGKPYVQL